MTPRVAKGRDSVCCGSAAVCFRATCHTAESTQATEFGLCHLLSQSHRMWEGDRGRQLKNSSGKQVAPHEKPTPVRRPSCPLTQQPWAHESRAAGSKNNISKRHLPSVAKYSRWHNVSSMYFESFESLSKITLSCERRKHSWRLVRPRGHLPAGTLDKAFSPKCLPNGHENT